MFGGEGAVIKFRGFTVQDMLLSNGPRPLKMACGENPKRVYGARNQMPQSRMGSGWITRQQFEQARKLKASQDEWCEDTLNGVIPATRDYPTDLSLEGLVGLLRGTARLQNHCYQVQDMEMQIRISREFGFNISAFHHALEAYKIPDQLKANNIAVATFADLWGYKMEAYDASVHAPKMLFEAGVDVILKTDHPVIFARNLMYEAAKAHHYGLPRAAAIAAVTSTPARAIGIEQTVGTIRVGLDGDVVVWDRDPLLLGATPNYVVIDGSITVSNPTPFVNRPGSDTPPAGRLTVTSNTGSTFASTAPNPCAAGVNGTLVPAIQCYFLTNVATIYVSPTNVITNGNILVQNGAVSCVATVASGTCVAPAANVMACAVLDFTGGTIIPGLFESLSHVGQQEIGSEASTGDGETGSAVDPTCTFASPDSFALF